MNDSTERGFDLPPAQQAIRDKCVHPSGQFDPFPMEDAENAIQTRFEKIVEKYPDRIAVKADNDAITYSALNKAANRLAHAVLALRGGAREPVAFSHAHGILPIVSHLALLKAGKISIELDPAAPTGRNAHIMVDSTAAILLTDNRTRSVADGWITADQSVLSLDKLDYRLGDHNPDIDSAPDDVAYIRYTSGSTGQAKGAVKTHRHVLHEVLQATNYFRLCIYDRISHLSRESMGKFVFSALLNGASLFPLDIKQNSLMNLAEWLLREKITTYQSFPTAFRYFTSSLRGRQRFPSLRLIRLEGELLYRRDFDLYKKHFPPECLLVNVYSSAETGTVSLYFMDHNTEVTAGGVPMGYPIEGKQVLLIDDHGGEVGVNQVGEIAVKSRLLASGYWQREEITHKKFIRNPTELDRQIYMTGDLGALSEQGLLQHFGRKDSQVKIRGFRVDAGEIEAALADHEEIKEAVVVARHDQLGNQELAAYVVTRSGTPADGSALRKFLGERLPDYMIPARFVNVNHIPLTATGKVDRLRLPALNTLGPGTAKPYVAPRTAVEEKLATIWRHVLSMERISVEDNFFDLGGHSLLATQVLSRIRDEFKLTLPFESLFEAQTIHGLAQRVQAVREASDVLPEAKITRVERERYRLRQTK